MASILYRYAEHNSLRGLYPKPSQNPWNRHATHPWDVYYRSKKLPYEFFAFHTGSYTIKTFE